MNSTSNNNGRRLLLFCVLLVIYEIATYLSNDAYLPALPYMAPALHTHAGLLPLTLTVWFLGSGCMQLVMGPLCDRFGRRPVLLIGGAVYIISSILCASSSNIVPFMLGRFLQGATIASMLVAGYATVHDNLSQKKAITTLAWMGCITVLAPGLGPLYGSAIVAFFDWRVIFISLAGLAALTLLGHFWVMPKDKKPHENPIPVRTAYMKILRNRNFMGRTCALALMIYSLIAWITAGPWIVTHQFHQPAYYFALYQVAILGAFFIGSQLVKLLMRKFSLEQLIKYGMRIALVAALCSLAVSCLLANQSLTFIISMMVVALSLGVVFPILNRTSIEASDAPMGSRVAMLTAITSGGAILASAAIAMISNITAENLAFTLVISMAAALACHKFIREKNPACTSNGEQS